MHQTVIIVDENPLCARMFKAMLEPLACRVLIARNAQDAARLFGIDADDDLLAERPLPGADWAFEDGEPEVAKLTPRVRPLFLVSAAREERLVRDVARFAGGETLLVRKPVARDGLATLVRRHLGGQH